MVNGDDSLPFERFGNFFTNVKATIWGLTEALGIRDLLFAFDGL